MFAAGGVVKGTLGVGLPLVVVPLLSLIMPANAAIGLLVMPVLISNALQAAEGGRLGYSLRRYAPLMTTQLIATLVANHFSRDLSNKALNAAIAFTVVMAVALMLVQPKGALAPRHQVWLGPVVGAVAGAMAGVSSLTGPVIITYLMALRLKRDEFVGSISIIYLLGAIPMYVAMYAAGRFGLPEVGISVIALVPVYLGIRIGASIRGRLSEAVFRRVLLAFLVLLSVMLLLKS